MKDADDYDIESDATSATISGLWVGIGSLIVGIAGLLVTFYLSYAKEPHVFWLVASGWIAGTLGVGALTIVGYRQVALIARLANLRSRLESKLADCKNDLERLTTIAEFLASQGADRSVRGRTLTPAKLASPRKPAPKKNPGPSTGE